VLQVTAGLELVYQDASGSTGAVSMHASSAELATAIAAQGISLAAIIAPVTNCELVRLRVRYRVIQSSPGAAADGSTVKRTGVFIFNCPTDNPLALIGIPGILDSALLTTEPGAGVLIDLANTDVAAFITLIDGGIAVNPFGDDIGGISTAYLQMRV